MVWRRKRGRKPGGTAGYKTPGKDRTFIIGLGTFRRAVAFVLFAVMVSACLPLPGQEGPGASAPVVGENQPRASPKGKASGPGEGEDVPSSGPANVEADGDALSPIQLSPSQLEAARRLRKALARRKGDGRPCRRGRTWP